MFTANNTGFSAGRFINLTFVNKLFTGSHTILTLNYVWIAQVRNKHE